MNISILTLNVWQGGLLWDSIAAFLKTQTPDILLLQEVYNGTNPSFAQRFRSHDLFCQLYPDFKHFFSPIIGDLRTEEGLVDNGNLTLSRWPIVEAETHFVDIAYQQYDHDATEDYSSWPGAVQRCIIEYKPGKQLQVGNLHGPVWMDGLEPTSRRQQMVTMLNSLLQVDMPTVIAGDTNASISNPCWEQLVPHQQAFGAEVTTTFNMKRKDNPGYATAAVDQCFTNQMVKILFAEQFSVDVSDHLPFLVEISIPD